MKKENEIYISVNLNDERSLSDLSYLPTFGVMNLAKWALRTIKKKEEVKKKEEKEKDERNEMCFQTKANVAKLEH